MRAVHPADSCAEDNRHVLCGWPVVRALDDRVPLAMCCGLGTRRSISLSDFPLAGAPPANIAPRTPVSASLPRSGAWSLTSRRRLA
jgi:hypothetical protein